MTAPRRSHPTVLDSVLGATRIAGAVRPRPSSTRGSVFFRGSRRGLQAAMPQVPQ